jgi:nitrate/nitrite transporter NarK
MPAVYASGWQAPLLLSAAIAATSFAAALAYWGFERRSRVAELRTPRVADGGYAWRDVLHFGRAYWALVALCVLWYAGILAFRSTFSIKYFQHVFELPLAEAGQMNSVIFLTSIVSTPLLGWLCDRTGRYSAILLLGSFLLPAAFVSLHFLRTDPHVGMVLIGMSYSLVGAAMWPMASKLVETRRFGTAIGVMWVLQNAAIAASNLYAGHLNDVNGAGAANPEGYGAMMLFFLACSSLGFFATVALWRAVPGRIGDIR